MKITKTGYWVPDNDGETLEHHHDEALGSYLAAIIVELVSAKIKMLKKQHAITAINYFRYSVVDFGCGDGYYIELIKEAAIKAKIEKTVHVTGYDGTYLHLLNSQTLKQMTHKLSNGTILPLYGMDFTKKDIFLPTFDFGICLEVMEHIPPEYEFQVLSKLFGRNGSAPKHVIISWAKRGQNGTGHVNCRNRDEVITLFTEVMEYRINEILTENLRTVSTLPWLKENIIAFMP